MDTRACSVTCTGVIGHSAHGHLCFMRYNGRGRWPKLTALQCYIGQVSWRHRPYAYALTVQYCTEQAVPLPWAGVVQFKFSR
jgi:hypothetical protein